MRSLVLRPLLVDVMKAVAGEDMKKDRSVGAQKALQWLICWHLMNSRCRIFYLLVEKLQADCPAAAIPNFACASAEDRQEP